MARDYHRGHQEDLETNNRHARDLAYTQAAIAEQSDDPAFLQVADHAIRVADDMIRQHPDDLESYLLRARLHQQMGHYREAAEDYSVVAGLSPELETEATSYLCDLETLRAETEHQRGLAQEAGDAPNAVLLLTEELRLAQALGDDEGAAQLAEELQVETGELTFQNNMTLVQGFAAGDYLTSENVGEAAEYVGFSCEATGETQLTFQENFYQLDRAEQMRILGGLQRTGLLEQSRDLAGRATEAGDTTRALYYNSRVALMEGNIPQARVHMLDFRDATEGTEDPELQQMREQTRGQLRQFALAEIERLAGVNTSLHDQRDRRFFVIGYMADNTSDAQGAMLRLARDAIESGRADTVEEAIQYWQSEHERLRSAFTEGNGVIREGWSITFPYDRPDNSELPALRDAAREYRAAFSRDPNAPVPEGIPTVRLEGGTLADVNVGMAPYHRPEVIRVEIGPQGGYITAVNGSNRYFPPLPEGEDRTRVVVVSGSSVYARHLTKADHTGEGPHGYRGGGDYVYDFRENIPTVNPSTAEAYQEGHPHAFDFAFGKPGCGTGHWTAIRLRDRDFLSVYNLGTREGLEGQLTSEARRGQLLETAGELRGYDGSYEVAGEVYSELFAAPMQEALTEVEPQRTGIETAVRTDHDDFRDDAQERLEDYAEHLEENDPARYQELFPTGEPTEEQIAATAETLIQEKIEQRLRQQAFRVMEGRMEAGGYDSISNQAWTYYEDMNDPLDRFWNLSDESWDAIADEVAITALTMPIGIGAGTAVRAGVGGTRLVLGASARGGMRMWAARGTVLVSGSVTEGLVLEGGAAFVQGREFSWESAGFMMLMSGSFHTAGHGWSSASRGMGLERAIETSSGLTRRGLQATNFTGMMTTQTLVATGASYVHGPEMNFADRIASNAVRMLAFHYGMTALNRGTGNWVARTEQRTWTRMRVAREHYRRFGDSDAAVEFARAYELPVETPTAGPDGEEPPPDGTPVRPEQTVARERPVADPDATRVDRPARVVEEPTGADPAADTRPIRVVEDGVRPAEEGSRPAEEVTGREVRPEVEVDADGTATVERPVDRVTPRDLPDIRHSNQDLMLAEFEVGDAIGYYRNHSQRMETLETLRQQGGEIGEAANRFYERLQSLEAELGRYRTLEAEFERTVDPQIRVEMERLLVDGLVREVRALSEDPYHQMDSAHNDTVGRVASELMDLDGALATVQVNSEANPRISSRGDGYAPDAIYDGPIRYRIDYARPEELPQHMRDGFEGVTPEEFARIDVEVSSPEQARLVRETLEGQGLEVLANDDIYVAAALTGKDLTVRLASGREVTVEVRVVAEPGTFVEAPAVEPWMAEAAQDLGSAFVDGRWVRVEGVREGRVEYDASHRADTIEVQSVEMDAFLAENFGELPLSEIRPIENGLSEYRLDGAADYLGEPISVVRRTNPATGETEYYALDGHHRLRAALDAGETNMRVRFIDYDYSHIEIKFADAAEDGYRVPERVEDLEINPTRFDDYRGEDTVYEHQRRRADEAGLSSRGFSDTQLAEVDTWLQGEGNRSGSEHLADTEARALARHLEGQGWSREALTNLVGWDRAQTIFHPPAPEHTRDLTGEEPLFRFDGTAEAPTQQRIGDVELTVSDGELWVRAPEGEGNITVNGVEQTNGQWFSLAEGGTVMIEGTCYARTLGELRPIQVAPSDAPVFARSDSGGTIMDNGNGQLTKVGGNEFHRAQLDAEQAALGVIQYNGLDIGPRLIGRPAPSELIISRIDARPLSEMSVTERQAIPEEAWTRMEGDLGQLRELGIQHGDLNPGNILWDGQRLHIIDFGVSRLGVSSDRDVLQARGLRDAIAEGRDLASYFPTFDVPAEAIAIPEVDYLVPEWVRPVERPATPEGPVPAEDALAEQVLARTGTDDRPSIAHEGDAEAGIRHFVGAEREPNYMSDRNQRENGQARAIVRDAQRILRQNGHYIDPVELREAFHNQIAGRFKEGEGPRRNQGNLEIYDVQLDALLEVYGVNRHATRTTTMDASRGMCHTYAEEGESSLSIAWTVDIAGRNRIMGDFEARIQQQMDLAGVESFEQLPAEVRIQLQDVALPELIARYRAENPWYFDN